MAGVNIKFTNGTGAVQTLTNIETVTFPTVEGGTAVFHQEALTSDATLESGGQMLNGIIGYGKDDLRVVGTIPTKTDSDITSEGGVVTIPAGYYAQQYQKQGDPTGDATLSSSDELLPGVTAYAKGVKYTGTCSTYIKHVSSVPETKETDIVYNETDTKYYVWRTV